MQKKVLSENPTNPHMRSLSHPNFFKVIPEKRFSENLFSLFLFSRPHSAKSCYSGWAAVFEKTIHQKWFFGGPLNHGPSHFSLQWQTSTVFCIWIRHFWATAEREKIVGKWLLLFKAIYLFSCSSGQNFSSFVSRAKFWGRYFFQQFFCPWPSVSRSLSKMMTMGAILQLLNFSLENDPLFEVLCSCSWRQIDSHRMTTKNVLEDFSGDEQLNKFFFHDVCVVTDKIRGKRKEEGKKVKARISAKNFPFKCLNLRSFPVDLF